MINKEAILRTLDDAELSDVEVLKEEDGLLMLKFFYDFDDAEQEAAAAFAESEEDEYEEDIEEVDEIEEDMEAEIEDEENLDYDEDDEYYDDSRLKYLSEVAIDYVGETLEDLRDDLGIEVQYVGYDIDEDNADSYEFVAIFFDKNLNHDIEELLDEMEI
ncbi:MAG: hypothetical protein QMB63_00625 [Clostridiaceae bacterium]